MSGLVNDQIDGIVCACANSVYQALFSPPAPGSEARFAQEMASLPGKYSDQEVAHGVNAVWASMRCTGSQFILSPVYSSGG